MAHDRAKGLTAKQARAIEALLTTNTISAAAEVAGVSRRTLTAWLADAQFCAFLRSATDDALAATLRRLTAIGAKAVDQLESLLVDGTKEEIRLRAASIVLGRLLQVRDRGLEDRIVALEEAMKRDDQNGQK